ncbi:hypothetical protein OH77DRAFT_272810 [Trametes cingulata]|nr:hypothetical protein OH77DRAFT_272810 [Trametes cingulata]
MPSASCVPSSAMFHRLTECCILPTSLSNSFVHRTICTVTFRRAMDSSTAEGDFDATPHDIRRLTFTPMSTGGLQHLCLHSTQIPGYSIICSKFFNTSSEHVQVCHRSKRAVAVLGRFSCHLRQVTSPAAIVASRRAPVSDNVTDLMIGRCYLVCALVPELLFDLRHPFTRREIYAKMHVRSVWSMQPGLGRSYND